MMKKRVILTILLILCMLAGSSWAAELTLFGPEKFVAHKKKLHKYAFLSHHSASSWYAAAFRALPEQEGYVTGTLMVWNGGPDGSDRVRSAHIWVNGRLVLKPWHLKKQGDVFRIPLKRLWKKNYLKVKIKGKPGSYLKVQIAETGPTGPIFSGPQQYPFVCRTEQSDLGQPLVDNYDGYGIAVYVEDGDGQITDELSGYCKDCSISTHVDYFYQSTDGNFYPLDNPSERPADLDWTTTIDGLTVPYIVRMERGTINRFIYGIAILWPLDADGHRIEAWNGKLLYQFSGGVAIGHDQGRLSQGSPLNHDALSRGYAVCYSTGNRTGVHYNLQLAGETAIMVKKHFIKRFGKPEYTISVGGSGGAIQQYVFAQNHPGLLDGIIPQRCYSDMITQSIYVGDCMLLEYYFDILAPMQGDFSFGGFAVNPTNGSIQYLGSILPRTLIEGLSSSDSEFHPIYGPLTAQPGSTECVNGWLGLTPLAMNPLFTDVEGLDQFPDDVVLATKWTHWDDLRNIYGVDDNGYAPSTWDNVGVQYGLQALKDRSITLAQFVNINALVGGWKQPDEMVPEGYPFSAWNEIQHLVGPPPNPADFDPWSIRNANAYPAFDPPAPRTHGDIDAMHAAYTSGHVFIGELDIPAIDVRDYLDPELDMHHAQQSFATRERIIEERGHADNQLIWMADPETVYPGDPTGEAMDLLDEWLTNIQNNPKLGVLGNKPAAALDKCYYADGSVYAGDDVWDGILDDAEPGPCTTAFPLFSTSRIVAGGDIKGDVFKCHLIPVSDAIDRGFYDPIPIDPATQAQLELIFPDGVCDFAQGDLGRPEWW